MLICNGIQKSGTCALMQICAELGYNYTYLTLKRDFPIFCNKLTSIKYQQNNSDQTLKPGILTNNPQDMYHGHICYSNYNIPEIQNSYIITVFRNPRNILVSITKHAITRRISKGLNPDPISSKTIRTALKYKTSQMKYSKKTWIDKYRAFYPWLKETNKHKYVRFESLFEEHAIKKIANLLSVKNYDLEKIQSLYQTGEHDLAKSITWSGELSDWTKYWDEGLDKMWTDMGGPELERDLGY